MGITKKWTPYTKDNVIKEPNTFGVYELTNSKTGEVLYVGEGRIRSRLLAHLPEKHITYKSDEVTDAYRYEETRSKLRAIQIQNMLIEEFKREYNKSPRFNTGKKY